MKIHTLLLKLIRWLNLLTNEQSAYILGAILVLGCLFISNFSAVNLFWLPLIVIFWGLLSWGFQYIESLTKSLLGKIIGSIFIVAITAVNLAIASKIINSALQVPASPFVYTQTVVGVLAMPFTAALIFSTLSPFLIAFALISEMGNFQDFTPKGLLTLQFFKNNKKGGFVVVGRSIAAIALLVMSLSFLKDNRSFDDTTSQFTRWFAFNFEMEKYSFCNVDSNTLVAYLDDNKIITATHNLDTYVFKVENCTSDL